LGQQVASVGAHAPLVKFDSPRRPIDLQGRSYGRVDLGFPVLSLMSALRIKPAASSEIRSVSSWPFAANRESWERWGGK
jgi:hypothetical protein